MAKPNNAPAAAGAPKEFKYTVARRVVVPTMKVETNVAYFVRFESVIEKRLKMEEGKDGKMEEKTIEIARVTNLETGEICEIVAGTVLMSELTEGYPEHGYVGHCFRILKKDVPGKRYKAYELDEITPE